MEHLELDYYLYFDAYTISQITRGKGTLSLLEFFNYGVPSLEGF